MKLLIEIPKEFERHFETDRFADSLQRLRADAHMLAGRYERETATMLIQALKHAISTAHVIAVVDQPHGRLIDATTLLNDLECRDWFDDADMHIAKRAVYAAHTIIPDTRAPETQRRGDPI